MSGSQFPATPLHPAINTLLASMRTGDPKTHNGLGLWPVFADCRPEPAYLTLVEALALDGFKITEVSEGGSVPSLRVINETSQHVLLFDGEELKGAKQNRILNTTILIAAGTSLDVPVSCTEQGRWSYASAEFGSSGSLAHAELRKRKSADVAMSLEQTKLAEDLDWFMPLRLPHHLTWKDVNGLEIDWEDLPHNNLHGFLDDGMAVPPDERTPLTLLRIAQGLERWKDVLQLLRDHPDALPSRPYAPMKCMAYRELRRWLPASHPCGEGRWHPQRSLSRSEADQPVLHPLADRSWRRDRGAENPWQAPAWRTCLLRLATRPGTAPRRRQGTGSHRIPALLRPMVQ